MEIVSFARRGYAGELVKVEADLRRGIPAVDIVGLPDGAVREARERVRAAIRNSGLEYPRERILINLSPAGLKKEGSSFDLAIAMAVLGSARGLARHELARHKLARDGLTGSALGERVLVIGELELSGTVRAVSGVLAAVSRGLEDGIGVFIVPAGNRAEAVIRKEATVIAVDRLTDAMDAYEALAEGSFAPQAEADAGAIGDRITVGEIQKRSVRWSIAPEDAEGSGYEDMRGQERLVRALQIAAAGGHHLIAYGPPGVGKTLALRRFPILLPDLGEEIAIAVTRIHGIAGTLAEGNAGLVTRPPFREPHQNTSLEGMIGGGKLCRPGEISLAHGGVLFLDEATQYRTSVLQALRSPLETGTVTVSRAGVSGTFPARFQLIAAINPCPCGNFGAEGRVCTCDPVVVERYWKRLTAPLLDRIDLRVQVGLADAGSLASSECPSSFSTEGLRVGIERARVAQARRTGDTLNAALKPAAVWKHCALDDSLGPVFANALSASRISGRGAHATLRVARTIADMAGSERIAREHLLEAVQLRRWSVAVPDFLRGF